MSNSFEKVIELSTKIASEREALKPHLGRLAQLAAWENELRTMVGKTNAKEFAKSPEKLKELRSESAPKKKINTGRSAQLIGILGNSEMSPSELAQAAGMSVAGVYTWANAAKKRGLIVAENGRYRSAEQHQPTPDEILLTTLRAHPEGMSRDQLAKATKINSLTLDKLIEAAVGANAIYKPHPGLHKAV